MASAGAAAAPDSMAEAGSSGVQHPPAAWQTQAAPGQVAPGSSAPSPESDDEKDGPEPVEYSPGGRYGRMDLVLGRGAFKTVYKAFDEEEGTEVAWNQVRVVELVNSKEERDRLFAEIRVLKQLKHKNIMSFHDSWLDQKTMCVNFITELFTSGTLRQYRKRHRQIDEEVLKRWAWQILCGLVYLHGHTPPIIHRDLKCDNIFINGSQGIVKIGDLGLATLLRARTAPQSVLGTPEFMAPELYEEEYDDRVDVYSYGMCLLELATMEYPYAECRNAAQIYRKVTLGVRPAGLANVPSRELAEFIAICIRTKDERPRSRQLLKHPYFDSIRERAAARAEALSATASQVDIFSDYASVSSSGNGSDSRSSDGEAGEASSGPAGASGSHPPGSHSGNGGESDDSLAPLPEAGEGPTSPAKLARTPSAPIASRRSEPGERELTGSLQSAVESLHTIAESLPGLLAEGSPSAVRAAMMANSAHQGEESNSLAHPDRAFRVRGKLQPDMEKLNLRLRIVEPEGPAKTVDFDFDLGADTAMSVASEMVEDLSLSAEDARAVAAAIRDEIKTLTGLLHRRGNDSLASSSNGEARAESTSSADKDRHPSGEHAEELQHPFDADDADLAPPAAQTEQPSPAGDRIQSAEHPFEPGGQLQLHAPAGGVRSSFSSASGGPARMSFEESSSQPGGRGPPSADTSPPATPLQQHHGQSLEGLPALRDPSGSVPLSADAAAAMAAASGTLRGRSTTPPPPSSPLPGGSPRGMSPLRLHSPAQSVNESMGVSAVGGGGRGGGRATPGSDGGSAMSLDALDSPAPEGGARPTLDQSHQGPLSAASFGSGEHRHPADRSMVHSGSDKTLKGIDSEQLSTQLGLVGMKRSGSGVLSPQPRAPERKVPLGKLFEDAGHITGVPPRRNGLHHAASLPTGEQSGKGSSPLRSAGNSFDSCSVRSAPASESGSGKQQGARRPPLAHGHAPSAAAASSQTQHSMGPHAERGSISGGERAPQSTATSLPAAVAGSLASLTQRFAGH